MTEIEIIKIHAPERVAPKDIVKLDISAKNSGNIPASADLELIIKQGDNLIANTPNSIFEFNANEEKNIPLYLDTSLIGEGKFDIIVQAKTIPKGTEKTTTIQKSVTLFVGEDYPYIIGIVGFAIIIILISIYIRRKK